MERQADQPDLSVVVGLIAGGEEPITNCLEALRASANGIHLECLVPYDSRLPNVGELRRKFAWAEFIDATSAVDAERFGASSREHHDVLRAIGLRRARGRTVALLEDHCAPAESWCEAVLEAHKEPAAAVGGAVENGVDKVLNWAVYYCDFGRYQNPVPTGEAEFLSDSNVSYKREALFSVEDQWRDAFHETSVNWELARRGAQLRLHRSMVVYQIRKGLRLGAALRERFVWGRSFAGTRVRGASIARRLILAALAWVLPLLLTWRIVANGCKRRRHRTKLLVALPMILVLQTVWAAGEFVGYVTGRAGGPRCPAEGSA